MLVLHAEALYISDSLENKNVDDSGRCPYACLCTEVEAVAGLLSKAQDWLRKAGNTARWVCLTGTWCRLLFPLNILSEFQ